MSEEKSLDERTSAGVKDGVYQCVRPEPPKQISYGPASAARAPGQPRRYVASA